MTSTTTPDDIEGGLSDDATEYLRSKAPPELKKAWRKLIRNLRSKKFPIYLVDFLKIAEAGNSEIFAIWAEFFYLMVTIKTRDPEGFFNLLPEDLREKARKVVEDSARKTSAD